MKLVILPVTPFQQNCSLVVCEATGLAALVDPGGEIRFVPGHGPMSSFGDERRSNPFVGDAALER